MKSDYGSRVLSRCGAAHDVMSSGLAVQFEQQLGSTEPVPGRVAYHGAHRSKSALDRRQSLSREQSVKLSRDAPDIDSASERRTCPQDM